ncbi:MAG: MarR family transcriptional regulator [Desulfuromonadaceae bacterium]|nr:MarR family transcriptional regulator [Desulfuromonadaceae bacterium]
MLPNVFHGSAAIGRSAVAFIDGDAMLTLQTDQPQNPSYEKRILRSLRRIIRAVELRSHKIAQLYKITGPQLACLHTIIDHGPMTSATLSTHLVLSPSTIVGIIDRLQEKGWVTRDRSTTDRRQILLDVTKTGREVVKNAPMPLQGTLLQSLEEISELERVAVTLALEKVVDMLEAGTISAAPILEAGVLTAQQPNLDQELDEFV